MKPTEPRAAKQNEGELGSIEHLEVPLLFHSESRADPRSKSVTYLGPGPWSDGGDTIPPPFGRSLTHSSILNTNQGFGKLTR